MLPGHAPAVPATTEQLQQALTLHRAGRLARAAALYRRVLRRTPDSADALHLLGVLHLDRGCPEEALPALERAVALADHLGTFHNTLGRALAATGQHERALAAFLRAAALRPGSAEIHGNVGRACLAVGARAEALDAFRQALALDPAAVEPRIAAAELCGALGRWDEALAHARSAHAQAPARAAELLARVLCAAARELEHGGRAANAEAHYRDAAAAHPACAEAHFRLGVLLAARDELHDARLHLERALHAAPDHFDTRVQLARTLARLGAIDQARSVASSAAETAPDTAEAHFNLGVAHHACGNDEEAIRGYEQALRLDPGFRNAHNNLGNLLKDRALARVSPDEALLDQAESEYRAALRADPSYGDVHHNLALLLLLRGRLREGWEEYEWRDRRNAAHCPEFVQPAWRGEALPDGTLFVYAEQGLGDTLQFCRYLHGVWPRCRRVILGCHPPLVRLLTRAFPEIDVLPAPGPVPLFDRHISLMSLPRLAGTEPSTIPGPAPYLFSNPHLRQAWRRKLGDGHGLRVGLAWRGNPQHARDAVRSPGALAVLPLLRCRGVTFFSLQKGPLRSGEEVLLDAGLVDRTGELHDFDDTAALVDNLDLVISCDTSVLHLAGALGVEAWAMLPASPDWRWLLVRQDSPWYPTLRLFRQQARCDWAGVVARMCRALRDREAGGSAAERIAAIEARTSEAEGLCPMHGGSSGRPESPARPRVPEERTGCTTPPSA